MSSILIRNLPHSRELDQQSMAAVSGGNSLLKSLGPVANVNINVNQNIAQFQNVEVNALNNVGVIGAGFGPLKLAVNPNQFAAANAVF